MYNYNALGYIPYYNNNEELCRLALAHDYRAFEYISDEVKNSNYDMCKFAISRSGYQFWYLPKHLKYNRDFCKLAIIDTPYKYTEMPEIIKNDEEFCKFVVRRDPWYITKMPDCIRNNVEVCKQALLVGNYYQKECKSKSDRKENLSLSLLIRFMGKDARANKEIQSLALMQNELASLFF